MNEPKDENMLTLLYFLEHILLGKEENFLIDIQWVDFVENFLRP